MNQTEILAACDRAKSLFKQWCGNSYEWDALNDIERRRWTRLVEREATKDAALAWAFVALERYGPMPGHQGPCGPESGCDGICVEAALFAEQLHNHRAVLSPDFAAARDELITERDELREFKRAVSRIAFGVAGIVKEQVLGELEFRYELCAKTLTELAAKDVEIERLKNNRDMWKDQCARQAEVLTEQAAKDRALKIVVDGIDHIKSETASTWLEEECDKLLAAIKEVQP